MVNIKTKKGENLGNLEVNMRMALFAPILLNFATSANSYIALNLEKF